MALRRKSKNITGGTSGTTTTIHGETIVKGVAKEQLEAAEREAAYAASASTNVANAAHSLAEPVVEAPVETPESRRLNDAALGAVALEETKNCLSNIDTCATLDDAYRHAYDAYVYYRTSARSLSKDVSPDKLEQRAKLDADMRALEEIAYHRGNSPGEIESFYTLKLRVSSQVNGVLSDEVSSSVAAEAEGILANPESYSLPTNLSSELRDRTTYAASFGVLDAVKSNPTPERWQAGMTAALRMNDDRQDVAFVMMKDLIQVKQDSPGLKDVALPKEVVTKYVDVLRDSGILRS
jgi:hypothetical protein